jgi:tRNA pseudouridine32 synthase/23S rRNA pseudouridine746 synthase
MKDKCFIPFSQNISPDLIPGVLNDPFNPNIPEICQLAAKELQNFLSKNQDKWKHNFGLTAHKETPIKGKMFGILVVKTANDELGYLSTFSGAFTDNPHPKIFVPSLFDISINDHFLSKGMTELTELGNQIKELEVSNEPGNLRKIDPLKEQRKNKSIHLQNELFKQYHFLNQTGETKSLLAIFEEYEQRKPAAGAGECAAPKLLQYAFKHNMTPLGIAEFWWGQSSRSINKKHGEFYPPCTDKCVPILGYMLKAKI